MNGVHMVILGIATFLVAGCSAPEHSDAGDAILEKTEDTLAVNICDLQNIPEQYLGKVVRFDGRLYLGHHEASLYSPDCMDPSSVPYFIGIGRAIDEKTGLAIGRARSTTIDATFTGCFLDSAQGWIGSLGQTMLDRFAMTNVRMRDSFPEHPFPPPGFK